jgi:predicted ester cyclase
MDRAVMQQMNSAFFTALPDQHYTLEDLIAEGDKVVHRFTMRATHQGEIMGIPPSGKVVTVTGIYISRFAGGKFVEDWRAVDDLGLMQQLGVIPQMAQTGP